MRDRPLIESISLRQWQHVAWATLGRYNLFLMHRSAGKSMFLAIVAGFSLLLARQPIKIAIALPSLKKARDLFWPLLTDLLEAKSTNFIKFRRSEFTIINTRTNASIVLLACSAEHPNQARGHRIAVLIADELDEMDPDSWHTSFMPAMQGLPSDQQPLRRILASGTPQGGTSLLTQIYTKYRALAPDLKDAEAHPGLTFRGDHTQPNQAIPTSVQAACSQTRYRVFHLSYTDTQLLNPADLENDRLVMHPDQFKREYEVDLLAQSDDILFALADLLQTGNENPDHARLNLTPTTTGPNQGHINDPDTRYFSFVEPVAGLDVASSIDGTSLYIRQGTLPLFLGFIKAPHTKATFDSQISHLDTILRRYSCKQIAVDAGGLGIGFIEQLEKRLSHYNFNIIRVKGQEALTTRGNPLYQWADEFRNTRSACYGLLAHYVRNHYPLPQTHSPSLHEELSAHRTLDNLHDKRLTVSPKKDVKALLGRSPDFSDCVAYSFIFEGLLGKDALPSLADVASGRTKPPTTQEALENWPELYPALEGEGRHDNQMYEESILTTSRENW